MSEPPGSFCERWSFCGSERAGPRTSPRVVPSAGPSGDQTNASARFVINHPSRQGLVSPQQLRDWHDLCPDPAVEMGGAPGHQDAGQRCEPRGIYDKGPTADSFGGYPADSYPRWGGFEELSSWLGLTQPRVGRSFLPFREMWPAVHAKSTVQERPLDRHASSGFLGCGVPQPPHPGTRDFEGDRSSRALAKR